MPGCVGGGADKTALYQHFAHRHPLATVIVAQDGLLERCAECGVFSKNPARHPQTLTCKKLRERRSNKKLRSAQVAAEEVTFFVNGDAIERVTSFRYLGQVLSEDDSDTPCIEGQLRRA